MQDPRSQRGRQVGALGRWQQAAGGGGAEFPLEGVVGGEEGALQRWPVEEKGMKPRTVYEAFIREKKAKLTEGHPIQPCKHP